MEFHEELRQYLASLSFAVLCVELDLGRGEEGVLLVKSSRDLLAAQAEAQAPVELGWVVEQTAHGPVICLVLRSGASGVGDLAGEVYFDVADPEDRRLLERFAEQERIGVGFLDEDLAVVRFATLARDEVERLAVEQVVDRAEELLERADLGDFEQAREAFQQAYPLDRLVAQALAAAPPREG